MDGSVATARRSLGLLLVVLFGDDSLLCIWERLISAGGEAIVELILYWGTKKSLVGRERLGWPMV